MSDETQRRIAQNQSDYAILLAERDALRRALGKITEIEFAGSCCGCGKDDGFDEVQKVASAALAAASPTKRGTP